MLSNNYNAFALIPDWRPQFERCVKATHADKYCKGFSAWQQFVTMTYAQIVNPHGIRSLEHSLNSNTTCLYHLGISKEVKRSTISYANNTRSPEVFEKLFYSLSSTLNRNERKKFRKKFYGIDATELSLNLHDFPWATFRSTMSGVKIHLKYDINNSLPEYLFITNANEHENNTLKKMNLSKGCTVAFDKGYCNYAVFGDFCRDKIFFVTRLKENAVKTQIWIALIVYLLFMKLRQLCTRPGKNFTDFISELKVCIFERKDLFEWFVGNPPPTVWQSNVFQQELGL